MSDLGDLGKLTVKVLQKELEDRGLETKGRKAELVARLTEALESGASGDGDQDEAASSVRAVSVPLRARHTKRYTLVHMCVANHR